MAQNESSTYLGPTTYEFASGIVVTQPNEMVYLDFFQLDREGRATSDQYGVARVVIHPALVTSLVEQLSAVRRPPEKDPTESDL